MRLRYTPRGFAGSEQIFQYLSQKSPIGARNVMTRLDTAMDQLLDKPHSGHATDMPDVMVLFIGRYPYKVFYRVRGDTVEILHIRHTSRRPPDSV